MRWSPEVGLGPTNVVRRESATVIERARFDIPLAGRLSLPPDVAEQLISQARAAGYAAGWAEGRQAAQRAAEQERVRVAEEVRARAEAAIAERDAAMAASLRAVADAVARLEQRSAPALADLERQLVDAAFALAETVVGRELAVATTPGRDAVIRALRFAPPGRPATVRLHPGDAADLPGTTTVDGREVVVVSDGSLQPGDAVVECDATSVESRLAAALDRARAVVS